MTRRMSRVNELLREELGRLILRDVRDPRVVAPLTSITGVDAAPDLHTAQVFVSVFGSPAEREATVEALQAAAGFVRRALGDRVRLKRVPALTFRLDTSIEEGEEMQHLIDRAAASNPERGTTE